MDEAVLARFAGLMLVCGVAVACGASRPGGHFELAGRPVDVESMTADQVQREVVVMTGGDGQRRYRAPLLRFEKSVDLKGASATVPGNIGVVELDRGGYLLGRHDVDTNTVRHFVVYRSEMVRGENRYARVTVTDGPTLSFRVATSRSEGCEPDCPAVVQSVIAEVPDETLRAASASGLALTMTLDNDYSFPVRCPAAYVQGYLAAVAADR